MTEIYYEIVAMSCDKDTCSPNGRFDDAIEKVDRDHAFLDVEAETYLEREETGFLVNGKAVGEEDFDNEFRKAAERRAKKNHDSVAMARTEISDELDQFGSYEDGIVTLAIRR